MRTPLRWQDETEVTDGLRAAIERNVGGKVVLVGEVVVGKGKTRATLHGGEVGLASVTVQGNSQDALEALTRMLWPDED